MSCHTRLRSNNLNLHHTQEPIKVYNI